ncbi:MAG: hypothetical protein KIS67_01475 [Verrucomicrobiae bacterium]|nr:hypothetical protein [Verrucomicrobiae bacterium]
MHRLTPFKLALILGCATEGVLIALGLAFAQCGPCTPANIITGVLMLLHLPGILLASPIAAMESIRPGAEAMRDTLAWAIVVVTSVLVFTGVAYLFTKRFKCLRSQ